MRFCGMGLVCGWGVCYNATLCGLGDSYAVYGVAEGMLRFATLATLFCRILRMFADEGTRATKSRLCPSCYKAATSTVRLPPWMPCWPNRRLPSRSVRKGKTMLNRGLSPRP